ncbi:hypothetical protein [Hymenobacter siberiensis]|uniref:hypothetical protein n=1 Tax=Hymenobacter siberiensis TaxID=2848396 RepID=UPI001C1E58A5|nr:hypothetical protein [Hymenobacter siberiensis]MBU6120011.1 hypothetical protein [Hymenobacter siberiensis]
MNYPALALALTGFQKVELWEYAQAEELIETRLITEMMELNPDYPYPDEYRNGREAEYLLYKHSPAYRDSQFVLQLLSAPPVRPLDTSASVAVPAPGATEVDKESHLSVSELALLCVYAGHSFTNEDAAKHYLEGSVKSGRALYNKFIYYCERSNRIGFADATVRKRKNMIARIQKVLPRLTDEQKKGPEREIVILEGQN